MSKPRVHSDETVRALREAAAHMTDRELAVQFGMSVGMAWSFRTGRVRPEAGGPITTQRPRLKRLRAEFIELRERVKNLEDALNLVLRAMRKSASTLPNV